MNKYILGSVVAAVNGKFCTRLTPLQEKSNISKNEAGTLAPFGAGRKASQKSFRRILRLNVFFNNIN